MALTYIPEDTDKLTLKTQRDITCQNCGQRRTIDGYDKATVAQCIQEDCETFFVIPAYPFKNSDITHVTSESRARELLNKE